tara:strand:- start:5737 stop:6564 length:828 start_codon:yes stop_codon:yes gene_type:complete
MNYFNVRKLHYKTQRKLHLAINASIDDWFFSPYHCLKVRFFLELSALFVFFLQYTPIKPNFLTILYVIAGIAGALLLGSAQENLIIAGVIVFFLYGIFDWSDGLLARVTKKISTLGSVLDPWAGYVVSFVYLIGLGLYLFNATQEIHFIYLMILIITIRALDLKDYSYRWLMYKFYKNFKSQKNRNRKKNKLEKNKNNFPKILIYLKNFFQSFLDERARTYDTIGLIILFELMNDKILLTNIIYYLFVVRVLAIFVGGFYIVYFKGLTEKIESTH